MFESDIMFRERAVRWQKTSKELLGLGSYELFKIEWLKIGHIFKVFFCHGFFCKREHHLGQRAYVVYEMGVGMRELHFALLRPVSEEIDRMPHKSSPPRCRRRCRAPVPGRDRRWPHRLPYGVHRSSGRAMRRRGVRRDRATRARIALSASGCLSAGCHGRNRRPWPWTRRCEARYKSPARNLRPRHPPASRGCRQTTRLHPQTLLMRRHAKGR